jgi:hypothetical protein
MAAQLTGTNARPARGESSWICRANSSLPVPDSPSSSTVAADGAACCTTSKVRRIASDCPTVGRRRVASSCARSVRFSVKSDCFSSAFSTTRTTCARLSGLVMKSYAPSRIASTAVSTVP